LTPGDEGGGDASGEGPAEAGPGVTVLFFANAREAAGARSTRAPADGRTLEELMDELCSTYGDGLKGVLATCAVWVNGSPAARTTVLHSGDEVALLPPVSGGAVPSTSMALNVDEAFDPGYLADLEGLSLTDLRAKRQACTELETDLSYLRRLAQARLDLIVAESERRHLGLSEPAPDALVEQLPQILADHTHAEGLGRLPTVFAPAEGTQLSLTARVEELIPSDKLGSLGTLSSAELTDLMTSLSNLERDVSAERRALHDIQDRLQEELVRRYRSGEANVDTLLG
jgi:molybdopterin converting factor small subunit